MAYGLDCEKVKKDRYEAQVTPIQGLAERCGIVVVRTEGLVQGSELESSSSAIQGTLMLKKQVVTHASKTNEYSGIK